MKRVLLTALLAVIAMILCGCDMDGYKSQRVEISRSEWRMDTIQILLREGEVISRDAYSIVATDNGYDIVIHVEREDGNAQTD